MKDYIINSTLTFQHMFQYGYHRKQYLPLYLFINLTYPSEIHTVKYDTLF